MAPPAQSGARSSESDICQNRADTPNFLYAALERAACSPFFNERRMKFREPTKLHRKSGIWGTRHLLEGKRVGRILRLPSSLSAPVSVAASNVIGGQHCRSLSASATIWKGLLPSHAGIWKLFSSTRSCSERLYAAGRRSRATATGYRLARPNSPRQTGWNCAPSKGLESLLRHLRRPFPWL